MPVTECVIDQPIEGNVNLVDFQSGEYVVRYKVRVAKQSPTDPAVSSKLGFRQLITQAQAIGPHPLPPSQSAYNYTAVFEGAEADNNSFLQGFDGSLTQESETHYLWDVFARFAPTPVGEAAKSTNPGQNPAFRWKWEIAFETFSTGEDIIYGWPSEDVRVSQTQRATAYPNFEDIPSSDTTENTRRFIVTRNGLLYDTYRREVINRPLLIARGWMQDLREFYRQSSEAVRTANKTSFFDQGPGWAKYSGSRILGGSFKDGTIGGVASSVYYHVQFEFECWGRINETPSDTSIPTEKLPPPSAIDVPDIGYAAWSGGNLYDSEVLAPIAVPYTNQTGQQVGEQLVPNAVPLNKDGTQSQLTTGEFTPDQIERTRWWIHRPLDYTNFFGSTGNKMPTTWAAISGGLANAP